MSRIRAITNHTVLPGRRNSQAWFAPSLAAVPGAGRDGGPEILVGVAQLTGMDIGPTLWLRTGDLGETWTPPMQSMTLLAEPVPPDVMERRTERIRTLFGQAATRPAGLAASSRRRFRQRR